MCHRFTKLLPAPSTPSSLLPLRLSVALLPLVQSVFSRCPPLVVGYLSISICLQTHYSWRHRHSSKANALWRVKQARSIQRRCSLGAVSPDHRCGQSRAAITTGAMSSPHRKYGTRVNENFRSAKRHRHLYCGCCLLSVCRRSVKFTHEARTQNFSPF